MKAKKAKFLSKIVTAIPGEIIVVLFVLVFMFFICRFVWLKYGEVIVRPRYSVAEQTEANGYVINAPGCSDLFIENPCNISIVNKITGDVLVSDYSVDYKMLAGLVGGKLAIEIEKGHIKKNYTVVLVDQKDQKAKAVISSLNLGDGDIVRFVRIDKTGGEDADVCRSESKAKIGAIKLDVAEDKSMFLSSYKLTMSKTDTTRSKSNDGAYLLNQLDDVGKVLVATDTSDDCQKGDLGLLALREVDRVVSSAGEGGEVIYLLFNGDVKAFESDSEQKYNLTSEAIEQYSKKPTFKAWGSRTIVDKDGVEQKVRVAIYYKFSDIARKMWENSKYLSSRSCPETQGSGGVKIMLVDDGTYEQVLSEAKIDFYNWYFSGCEFAYWK